MNALNAISLNVLRAVEAVGRLGSLASAAAELGVTPGAVSQRVIEAERRLDLTLFERTARGMTLTEAGARALPHLSDGFRQLEAGLARMRPAPVDGLTVSVAPVFAARWLIWRLPRFNAAHPGLKVRLDASLALTDPDRDGVDLCIRVGRGGWPGVRAERLFPQVIFPVCSPDLAGQVRTAADLSRVPIIRESRPGFTWEDWLGPEGLSGLPLAPGPEFSDSALCIDAAMSGAGVFLGYETLSIDALTRGNLIRPFEGRHATANSYWLVRSATHAPGAAAVAFARWLKAEVSEAGLGRI